MDINSTAENTSEPTICQPTTNNPEIFSFPPRCGLNPLKFTYFSRNSPPVRGYIKMFIKRFLERNEANELREIGLDGNETLAVGD